VKNLFFIFLVLVTSSYYSQNIIVTGKVLKPHGRYLSIHGTNRYLIELNEDGIINDSLENAEDGYYNFVYSNVTTEASTVEISRIIYLEVGDSINITGYPEYIKLSGNKSLFVSPPPLPDSILVNPSLRYSFETKSILDLERDLNLKFDDSLYVVDARIRQKAKKLASNYNLTNKDDLEKFFKDIKKMLFDEEWFDQRTTDFYSESLNGRGTFQVRTIDCYAYSLLYSTIAKDQSIDIGTVLIRDHILNEVSLESGETFYWDGTKQQTFSREEIKNQFNLNEQELKKASYLERLNENELLAITYFEMARRMNTNGYHDEAIAWCNHTLKIYPKNIIVLSIMALALNEIGNNKAAISTAKDIIKYDNKNLNAKNMIASFYAINEKYQSANYWYTQVINHDNQNVLAHYGRGLCYAITGNKYSAEKEYKYLIQKNTFESNQCASKLRWTIDNP